MNTLASSQSWRLFLGLWPTAATRAELIAHADAWHWPAKARRTRLERLHVTLQFLGNVEAEQVDLLRQALAVPWPGCPLLLDRPTVWPGGIAVLEASAVPQALTQLHEALAERLRQAGLWKNAATVPT